MSKALIEYGCSCAGKSIIGKKIKSVIGGSLKIIGTGEYFRAHKELHAHAKKGLLVENRHVMEFFEAKILECNLGDVILDSPRNHDQVVLLADMLKQFGYTTIASVFVDTSIKNCRVRLEARAHKEHRDDDKDIQAIETRLNTFLEESPSVVTALQQYTDPYFHANGDKDIAGMEAEAVVIAHEVFGPGFGFKSNLSVKKQKSHPDLHLTNRRKRRNMRLM